MPNTIDANGLTVKTYDEINTDLTTAFQNIYGLDVNLDSNSPDGQMIGVFTKSIQDVLEFQTTIYNSFSIANAFGITLHNRVALNGIVPKTGTYTTTPVNITANTALTLYGLDAIGTNPNVTVFTVQDTTVQWQLVSTYSFGGSGTQALVFKAIPIGPTTPIANTINTQTTPISGVTTVNNPTIAGSVIGMSEEPDSALKIRHGQSFMLAATGPADSVEAAILNLTDVVDAKVLENVTSSPSGGIPAHSLWVIVRGGTASEIGTAIYNKKSSGCGLTGGQSYVVARPNGQSFTSYWDLAVALRMYARFTIVSRITGLTFDHTLLAQELAAAILYRINQVATAGDLVVAMNTIEPRAILTSVGVSKNNTDFYDTIAPTSALNYFTLAAADITIS